MKGKHGRGTQTKREAKDREAIPRVMGPRSDDPAAARSPLIRLWIVLGLAVSVIAVYGQMVGHAFINMDDGQYIGANPFVARGLTWDGVVWAFTSSWASNWHPLTWLSHMLDVTLFGLHPAGHFAHSLLLHVANTLLLFLVLERMTRVTWRSAMVAALFALHPLHVESVAWAAERKDVLSTLFWILAIGAYALYVERPEWRRYGAIVGLFALGLLAKPMLVTLPFTLLLLDVWPLGRLRLGNGAATPLWRLVTEKIPLLMMSAASSIATVIAQGAGGSVEGLASLPFADRMANAVVAYARYLGKTFAPAHLAIFYPYPFHWPALLVAGSSALLVVVSVAAFLLYRRAPYVLVGWLWFLGTLVPVIGLVQVGSASMADRYTYVPLVGIFWAVVWGLADLSASSLKRRQGLGVLGVAVLVACAALTAIQVGYWKNSATLFAHALQVTPSNAPVHDNLAAALEEQGRVAEAVEHYRAALRIKPDDPIANYNLGLILLSQGQADQAVDLLEKAAATPDADAANYVNLGRALSKAGRETAALSAFARAVEMEPGDGLARRYLADALFRAQRFSEAAAQLREVLRLRPDDVKSRANLAASLNLSGQHAEAWTELQRCLREGGQPPPDLVRDLTAEFGANAGAGKSP